MRQITKLEELEEDKKYCFHGEKTDKKAFTVDRRYDDEEFLDYGEGCIQFLYKDGYVADLPVSNVRRYVQEGRLFEI